MEEKNLLDQVYFPYKELEEQKQQKEEVEKSLDELIKSYSYQDVETFFSVEMKLIKPQFLAKTIELKQNWEILKTRNKNTINKVNLSLREQVNLSLREQVILGIIDLKEEHEKYDSEIPIFKIELEHFESIYSHAGESFAKKEDYWAFCLRVIYILLFFSKKSLKELQHLEFSQINDLVESLDIPTQWEVYLYENIAILKKVIFEVKKQLIKRLEAGLKRLYKKQKFTSLSTSSTSQQSEQTALLFKEKLLKAKEDLKSEKVIISTDWNAFYRKVALDLKHSEKYLFIQNTYRITPRSFLDKNHLLDNVYNIKL